MVLGSQWQCCIVRWKKYFGLIENNFASQNIYVGSKLRKKQNGNQNKLLFIN